MTGAETFEARPWGYEDGRLVNIDHHAPTARMRQRISSANLALQYVDENGVTGPQDTVVLNHTDCDSVLAAAIVRGDVEPLEMLGQAAIAADHTGEENAVADLLQALDEERDYYYSLQNLRLLLEGKPLEARAQAALAGRHAKRRKAEELVRAGAFTVQNGMAWAEVDDTIDGELFPALLPQAVLIAMFSPREGEAGKWNARFRLGNAAPPGLSLAAIITAVDAGYSGRWNAGSNKRTGGGTLAPQEYAKVVMQRLEKMG